MQAIINTILAQITTDTTIVWADNKFTIDDAPTEHSATYEDLVAALREFVVAAVQYTRKGETIKTLKLRTAKSLPISEPATCKIRLDC